MDGDPDRRLVFLSHTSELRVVPTRRPYVVAAESAVSKAGCAIADMAYFPSSAAPPAEVCADAVREADALVLIAGFRYGSPVPDRPDLSHTEWEFDVAGRAGIPRLVFLLDEAADGSAELAGDSASGSRQQDFRERLRRDTGLTVSTVDSPGALEAAVLHSLGVTFADRSRSTRSNRTAQNIEIRDSRAVQTGDDSIMITEFHDRPHRRWRFPWPRRE